MQQSHPPPPQLSARRPAAQRPAIQPRAATVPARSMTESSDSWIEIPSNPSDASSSDEHPIITSGLRIARRKRRNTFRGSRPSTMLADTSSSDNADDDDEEGEAPEDVASFIATQLSSSGFTTSSGTTDDEGASDSGDDPAPRGSDRDIDSRTVFASSSSSRAPHPRLNHIASQQRTDHDEALRASLSTLLSCAAAARGLPKPQGSSSAVQAGPSRQARGGTVEGLRVVQGSSPPRSTNASSPSSSTAAVPVVAESRKKRSSSTSRSSKKSSARGDGRRILSAGLYTLAVSAGAIVVLTAISFSAGYLVGREIGRADGGLLSGPGSRAVRRVGRVTG